MKFTIVVNSTQEPQTDEDYDKIIEDLNELFSKSEKFELVDLNF